jgi:hypothetical protein
VPGSLGLGYVQVQACSGIPMAQGATAMLSTLAGKNVAEAGQPTPPTAKPRPNTGVTGITVNSHAELHQTARSASWCRFWLGVVNSM